MQCSELYCSLSMPPLNKHADDIHDTYSVEPAVTNPPFVSVSKRLMEVAVRFPTAIAVRGNLEAERTYEELVRNAIGLAAYLQSLGVAQGNLVAIALDRSYGTVVSLLGTWLSGAAYMAIDPAYPESRIEYILQDSGAAVVVTSPGCHHLVPASFRGAVIDLNPRGLVVDGKHPNVTANLTVTHRSCGQLLPEGMKRPQVDCDARGIHADQQFSEELSYRYPDITPEMLACVWYTSGTSGNPKGVLIDHGAFAQAVANIPSYPGFGPGCCFGQISSPCYAGHVADLWKPLTMGAALAFIPKDIFLDPLAFGRVLNELDVSGVIFTPKILEMFADVAPEVLSRLKLIQFAGERVRLDAVLKLAACLPPGTLLQHLYGCSEHCSIISGLEIVAGVEAAATLTEQTASFGRLPAGHAVKGAKIYIVDPDTLEELPEGEVGEICIAGRQLAIGYHNRPEKTQLKFRHLPRTGERIYCSGDLGRMAPHGLGLDVMGRAEDDGMIKINGHRIELGDIEAAAMAAGLHVTGVAARMWKDTHLVLYVAPNSVDTVEMKQRLKLVLPSYMVPSLIKALPSIPLNVSGKLDSRMLPDPSAATPSSLDSIAKTSSLFTAADVSSELELDIMSIFSEVLNIPSTSLTPVSSFTGLSGHSLQAMALLGLLRKQLSCPALQFIDILEDDCPRHIASVVERYRSPHYVGHVLPDGVQCVAAGRLGETPVWVMPGGQGRPRVGIQVGRGMTKRPLYAIEITEEAAEACAAHPVHPLDGLVGHFIKLIKQVQPQGPYILSGNRVAYTVAHTLEQAGDEVERVIILEDSPLHFSRKEVDAQATQRHDKGVFGLIKFNVLQRVFPDDPEAVEAELDRYEQEYYDNMPDSAAAFMNYMMDAMAAEAGRWLGYEEGRRWRLGLYTCLPLLTDKRRPCARPGQDVLKAPISVIKASDSWMHTRVNELYDPVGLHNYSWGAFTSAGAVDATVVSGNHYTICNDDAGAHQVAHLLDNL